jgi:hypothetical protein
VAKKPAYDIEKLLTREIPHEDADFLYTACFMKKNDEDGEVILPESVRREYWSYKAHYDRLESGPIPPFMLALIALNGMRAAPAESVAPMKKELDKPKSIPDMLAEGLIAYDDPCRFKYRNKWYDGVFKGLTSDQKQAQCLADGEADLRTVDLVNVEITPIEEMV